MLKLVTNIGMTAFLLALSLTTFTVRLALGLVTAVRVLLLPLLFFAMTPADMWKAFKALTRLAGIQVIGHKTYQLGATPDADAPIPPPRVREHDAVYAEFLAEQDEFYKLRAAANLAGLWFGYFAWTELGRTSSKFVYQVWLVEKTK